jgi:hypothetical protein
MTDIILLKLQRSPDWSANSFEHLSKSKAPLLKKSQAVSEVRMKVQDQNSQRKLVL